MSQTMRKSLLHRFIPIAPAAIALTLNFALPAHAASVSYSGDTTNGQTWNRPQTEGYEGGTNPPTALSSNGTNVSYYSQTFYVDTTGSYDIVGSQSFLGIQFLYQNSFNSNEPLVNLVSGNDSFPDEGNSGFSGVTLTAQTQYILVTTGFDNTENSYGTFTNTITGPGNTTIVPEPISLAGTVVFGMSSLMLKRKVKQAKSIK